MPVVTHSNCARKNPYAPSLRGRPTTSRRKLVVPNSRFEPATPFSEAEICEIEKAVGRQLPENYREFVKEYGGAFVGGLIDGSEELPILTFFRAAGVLSNLETHPDLREIGALPIADCEFGNLYVLEQSNTVHYITYYGGKTAARKVADSFEDFLARIVVPPE